MSSPSVYSVAKLLEETREAFSCLDNSLAATLVDVYRCKSLKEEVKNKLVKQAMELQTVTFKLAKELEEIKS